MWRGVNVAKKKSRSLNGKDLKPAHYVTGWFSVLSPIRSADLNAALWPKTIFTSATETRKHVVWKSRTDSTKCTIDVKWLSSVLQYFTKTKTFVSLHWMLNAFSKKRAGVVWMQFNSHNKSLTFNFRARCDDVMLCKIDFRRLSSCQRSYLV